MGVQRLWDILGKAERFGATCIGIDASIWYQHATFSKGGENPELRLLFYRLRSLAELPVLPLFVFDGRERPKMKRSKKGKSGSHSLTTGMRNLIELFGMDWRMARGEAEAELARLNSIGVIDAIMTDDVDALIFGAQTIIRNSSLTLSGNKSHPALNLEGQPSKYHVMIYRADKIRTHPDINLSRAGLILIALLSGGDYDDGIKGFGPQVAHGLARCGFGERLLRAFDRRGEHDMAPILKQWRDDINTELRTNSHGLLPTSQISFPFRYLSHFLTLIFRAGEQGGGAVKEGKLNLAGLAGFCEAHFSEWGYRSAIIKRFRNLLWPAAVMHVLRCAALEADEREKNRRIASGRQDWAVRGALSPLRVDAVGTPSTLVKKSLSPTEVDLRAAAFVNRGSPMPTQRLSLPNSYPLIRKIAGSRTHASMDNMLEYRVEIAPTQLIALAQAGIKGKVPEASGSAVHSIPEEDDDFVSSMVEYSQSAGPKGSKKPIPEPNSILRMWLPAKIVRQVHPELVEDFESPEDNCVNVPCADERGNQPRRFRRSRPSHVSVENDYGSVELKDPMGSGQYGGCQIPGCSTNPSGRRMSTIAVATGPTHTRHESMDDLVEYSLPQRECGFILTLPNPDETSPEVSNSENLATEQPSLFGSRYDRLCKQILGIIPTETTKGKGRAKAPRKSRKTMIPVQPRHERSVQSLSSMDIPANESEATSSAAQGQMSNPILGAKRRSGTKDNNESHTAKRKKRSESPAGLDQYPYGSQSISGKATRASPSRSNVINAGEDEVVGEYSKYDQMLDRILGIKQALASGSATHSKEVSAYSKVNYRRNTSSQMTSARLSSGYDEKQQIFAKFSPFASLPANELTDSEVIVIFSDEDDQLTRNVRRGQGKSRFVHRNDSKPGMQGSSQELGFRDEDSVIDLT